MARQLKETISVVKKQLSPLTNFTSPTAMGCSSVVHPEISVRKKLRNIRGNEPSRQTNNDGATSNSNTNNEQPWTITPSIFQVTFDYPTLEKKHFSNLRKGHNGKNQNSIQSNSDFLSQREIDQTPGGSKLSTLGVQHFLGGRSKILCFTSPCWVFRSFETCLEPIFSEKLTFLQNLRLFGFWLFVFESVSSTLITFSCAQSKWYQLLHTLKNRLSNYD